MSNKKKVVFVLIGIIIIVICICLADPIIRFFKNESEMRVYSGTKSYIKDTDQYDNILNVSSVAELDGILYYINPDSNIPYQFNKYGEDVAICTYKMEYMIITEGIVFYTYENEVSMFIRDSEGIEKISGIYEDSASETVLVCDKLFFINDKQRVCTYDIESRKIHVISNQKAKSFKIYGDCIFYTTKEYGMNAMNIDGSNQRRITDAYIWNYRISNDNIFITNDSNTVLKIDMNNNTYCKLTANEGVNPFYLQIVNGYLYFVSSDIGIISNDRSNRLIQTDLNGEGRQIIREYASGETCWVADLEGYFCTVFESRGNSTLTIYSDENSESILFEETDIYQIKGFEHYIVIRANINDKITLILYDMEFNEIGRVD